MNKLPNLRYGIMLTTLAFPVAVAAQNLDYTALEELFEEPVTLSVTGSPLRASDVPGTMTIITREQIRRSGAKSIPGILRQVNGVDVLGWTNSGADVGVRGYNSALSHRVLVLVNGRQVYADHYGYTHWSSLPVEIEEIQQIEIVKGPNSALFGFNAVTGVINIITVNPLYNDLDMVTVNVGTQDTLDVSAITTFRLGANAGARLSLGRRRNDDFSTPLRLFEEGLRFGDERDSVALDTHFNLLPNLQLEVEASRVEARQTDMGAAYLVQFQDLNTGSLKANLTADTGWGVIEGTVYRNSIEKDIFNKELSGDTYVLTGTPWATVKNEFNLVRLQDLVKLGNNHTLRLTAEFRQSSLDTLPLELGKISTYIHSLSGMWNWQFNESLSLVTALRRDRLHLDRKGSFPAGLNFSNSDWDRSLTQITYNAGLVWQTSDSNTLRLSLGHGAQLPSLFDLGGNLSVLPFPLAPGVFIDVFATGLPDIDPSEITSYELGWERLLPVIDGSFSVTIYTGESRDIIASTGTQDFSARIYLAPANLGDSEATGLEVNLSGRRGNTWQWNLGYSYEDVDDDFQPGFPTSLTVTDFEHITSLHRIKAGLGWAQGPWEIDTHAAYDSEFHGMRALGGFGDTLGPLTRIRPFIRVDARAAYIFNECLTVDLSGQNLLNREQRQTSGPEVERRILLGISLAF